MRYVEEQVKSPESAQASGFYYVGIFPQPGQPNDLLARFVEGDCEVALCAFDDLGQDVVGPWCAVWVNPAGSSRDCGCVNCAEQGISCEHDLETLEQIKREILG